MNLSLCRNRDSRSLHDLSHKFPSSQRRGLSPACERDYFFLVEKFYLIVERGRLFDVKQLVAKDVQTSLESQLREFGFFAHLAERNQKTKKLENSPALTADTLRDSIISSRDLSMFDEIFSIEPDTQEFGIRFMKIGNGTLALEISRNMNNKNGSEVYFYTGAVGALKDEGLFTNFMEKRFKGEEIKTIQASSPVESKMKIFKEKEDVENCLDVFCDFLFEQNEKDFVPQKRLQELTKYIGAIKERGLLKNNERLIMQSQLIIDDGKVYGVDMMNGRKRRITELARTVAEQKQAEELEKYIIDMPSGTSSAYVPKSTGLSTISQGKRAINVMEKDENGNISVKIAYTPPGTTDEQLHRIVQRIENNELQGEFMTLNKSVSFEQIGSAIVSELGIVNSSHGIKLLEQASEMTPRIFIPKINIPEIFPIYPIPMHRLHEFNLQSFSVGQSLVSLNHFNRDVEPSDRIIDFSTFVFLGSTTTLFREKFREQFMASSSDSVSSKQAIDFFQIALTHETEYGIRTDNKGSKMYRTEAEETIANNLSGIFFEEEDTRPGPTNSPAHLKLPKIEGAHHTKKDEIKIQATERLKTMQNEQKVQVEARQFSQPKMKSEHKANVKNISVDLYVANVNDIAKESHNQNCSSPQEVVKHYTPQCKTDRHIDIEYTEADRFNFKINVGFNDHQKQDKNKYDSQKSVVISTPIVNINGSRGNSESVKVITNDQKLNGNYTGKSVGHITVVDQILQIDHVEEKTDKMKIISDEKNSSKGKEKEINIRLPVSLLNLVVPPKIIFDKHIDARIESMHEVEARRIWEMFLKIYMGVYSKHVETDKQNKLIARQEILLQLQNQGGNLGQNSRVIGILLISIVNFILKRA